MSDESESIAVARPSAVPDNSRPTPASQLDAQAVVAYLRTHTDFFLEFPDLLAVLSLPRDDGRTISFAHRQAALLRERNSDLRGRLQGLLATARTNDDLFDRTRTLSLALMRTESEAEFNAALAGDLMSAFNADHLACYFKSEFAGNKGSLYWCTEYPLAELFNAGSARCVTLRVRELDLLFPTRQSRGEGSAVLISLPGSNGMLAIGSDSREHFDNEAGMLFVEFLGELVDATAQRLVRDPSA